MDFTGDITYLIIQDPFLLLHGECSGNTRLRDIRLNYGRLHTCILERGISHERGISPNKAQEMGFHNAGGHKRTMKNLQWAASLGAEALARSIKNTPQHTAARL
jgi:hypothetical protein